MTQLLPSDPKLLAAITSLQQQVLFLQAALQASAVGANQEQATKALVTLEEMRNQENAAIGLESASGGPMIPVLVWADPDDLQLITEFGGSLSTGLHRCAQMVLGQAVQAALNRDPGGLLN